MTALRTRFTDDMKTAMKAGEKLRLDTIRLIIAKMKEADVNARAAGKGEASEAEILSLLQGMMKQRAESAKIFHDNARPELAAQEEGEMAVITGYLPQQLTDDEAGAVILAIIAETGAAGMKDMGRVMAAAKDKLAGSFDMTKASALVKSKLVG